MKRVLIIDDELARPVVSEEFAASFRIEGYEYVFAANRGAAWDLLRADSDFALIVLDIVFENMREPSEVARIREISEEIFNGSGETLSGNEYGLPMLRDLRRQFPEIPVVVLSSKAIPKILLWCWRNAASYYIVKPPQSVEAVRSVLDDFSRYVHRELLVGASAEIRGVRERARIAAGSGGSVSVLITGESGTGKELVARSIHQWGPRHSGPMVVVNCAAIPSSLIESELFGHRKGSFTGAIDNRKGKFLEADGGVLFLDEIGELSLEVQSKLLRALDRGMRFSPIGSAQEVGVDVQVLTATNRDLRLAVDRKEFRGDLFYRLNVFPIEVPPLRSRRADIPVLAEHFLRLFTAGRYAGKRSVRGFSETALQKLTAYSWPGNVRELENAVEYALLRSDASIVADENLPDVIQSNSASFGSQPGVLREGFRLKEHLARVKWDVIHEAYLSDEDAARPGLIERVSRRIGLENSSDLQRTVLPQIIRECPDLETDIRGCFPERQKS